MEYMNDSFSEKQLAFISDVGPIIRNYPGGLNAFLSELGLPVGYVKDFLDHKHEITESELLALSAISQSEGQYLDWEDGNSMYAYELGSGYTLMPKTPKAFIECYDCFTRGGDHTLACEIISSTEFFDCDWRYVLIDRCYSYALFITPYTLPFDNLLNSKRLINYNGARCASEDLCEAIDLHREEITNDPGNHRTLNNKFFANKELVFSQLALSMPK